ncbi:MAG: Ankyrin [Chthonomonadales bacterium]|nr:Ankyrin [Chthonomonadales bacterium]
MAWKTMHRGLAVAALFAAITVPAVAQSGGAPQDEKTRKAGILTADLFLAITHDDPTAADMALAHGADPNGRNWLGFTPLMWAALKGNQKIADTLLAHKAELDAAGNYGTALSASLIGRRESMALHLLDKGAGIHGVRVDGATALMIAAGNGETQVIKALLDRKDNPNAVDGDGATALIYAARTGKAEAVTLLLQAGSGVDVADSRGRTSLMYAAENGFTACADRLLAGKANVNMQDKTGATALTLAARHSGSVAVIRSLMSAGADPTLKDASETNASTLAGRRGFQDAAKLLHKSFASATPVPSVTLTETRPAVEHSLTALQNGMKSFAERAPCVSCHHQGLGVMVLGAAAQRGFAVDKELLGSYLKQVGEDGQKGGPAIHLALMDKDVAKTIQAVDIGDISIGAGYIFGGLIANGVPTNPGLQEMAQFLTMQQMPDGQWGYGFNREPMQSSHVTTTALIAQVLHTYGAPGQTAEALNRAKHWLLTTPTPTSEDKAARLLGSMWAGATSKEREKPVRELLAAQRPDGGWAVEPNASGSDAYATGMALYALHLAGGMPTSAPAYQNGTRFLLRTQDEDGSWYLNKRCNPANTYFDAGFPNGVSQYASFAATCWATLALMQSDKPATQLSAR